MEEQLPTPDEEVHLLQPLVEIPDEVEILLQQYQRDYTKRWRENKCHLDVPNPIEFLETYTPLLVDTKKTGERTVQFVDSELRYFYTRRKLSFFDQSNCFKYENRSSAAVITPK